MKAAVLLALITLAGCATTPRESAPIPRETHTGKTLDPYAHWTPEQRAAMLATRDPALTSAAIAVARTVSEHGVNLSAFGVIGASGIIAVADCKQAVLDARLAGKIDRGRQAEFYHQCYQLLPADKRNVIEDSDLHPSLRHPHHVISR